MPSFPLFKGDAHAPVVEEEGLVTRLFLLRGAQHMLEEGHA